MGRKKKDPAPPESAQDVRDGLGMGTDMPPAQDAAEGAAAGQIVGPADESELAGCQDEAELSAFQAKFTYNKSPVNMCGAMAEDAKVTSVKGTGSITVSKVYTRNISQADSLMEGRDVRCTIVAKLDDPDAYGAERVALYNVSFDDETIMDFSHGNLGQTTHPFTFTRREWLDVVRPQ